MDPDRCSKAGRSRSGRCCRGERAGVTQIPETGRITEAWISCFSLALGTELPQVMIEVFIHKDPDLFPGHFSKKVMYKAVVRMVGVCTH